MALIGKCGWFLPFKHSFFKVQHMELLLCETGVLLFVHSVTNSTEPCSSHDMPV